MPDLLKQLELPSEYSEETLYVKRLKETIAVQPENRGGKVTMVYKLSRETRGAFMAAAAKHGMTMTDILTLHIEQIIPVLQKAKPIDVPGYKKDMRTSPTRSRRS